jgi:citrate synthase
MFSNWLRENRPLPKPVWGIMHVLPDNATPMEALRTVASTLSMFDKACIHEEDGGSSLCRAVSITAKLPTIVASFDRLRRNKPPIEPNPELGHEENFVYILTGEIPDRLMARAIEVYLILLAEMRRLFHLG